MPRQSASLLIGTRTPAALRPPGIPEAFFWPGGSGRSFAHFHLPAWYTYNEDVDPEKSIWTQIPEVGASKRNLMNADKDRQKKSLDTK
jgi:hypothetical protein